MLSLVLSVTIISFHIPTGSYDQTQTRNLMKECVKAKEFDHPNIQELIGICIDGGPAPFIVMPFMDNGSLLSCLRRKREKLLVKRHASEDEVRLVLFMFLVYSVHLQKYCNIYMGIIIQYSHIKYNVCAQWILQECNCYMYNCYI